VTLFADVEPTRRRDWGRNGDRPRLARGWRAGGVAWFAFGTLFAAAPWHGVTSNALTGSVSASGGGLSPATPGEGVPRRDWGRNGDRPRLARGCLDGAGDV
jgi:hypothetical protein